MNTEHQDLITRKAELQAEYAAIEYRTWDVLNEKRKSQIRDILNSIERQLASNDAYANTGKQHDHI